MVFLLMALFSYLFRFFGKKSGSITEYELDTELRKSVFSRLGTGIVGIISLPARKTFESFLNFGNYLYSITSDQFIFGMRFIHSFKQETPLEFVHEIYQLIISQDEINKVFSFLKFINLINITKRNTGIFVYPSKNLQQYQQRYSKPSDEFPSINEMNRLQGILMYLREKHNE